MNDRRTTPANDRVAAAHLRDRIKAPRYVAPDPAQIAIFAAGLHAEPDGPLDRQLLFGDPVDIYDRRDGWAFLQAQKDGYCGYVRESSLATPTAPTHAVRTRQTHIYPEAGFKAPPLARLPFAARIAVTDIIGDWAETDWGGVAGRIHTHHMRRLDWPMPDLAHTAALFLGTPYLWAGNTGDGIDCSGLVQAACLAAHIPCPGDSDLQARTVGTPLDENASFQRNDLIFWQGHVALAENDHSMIHATAHGMTTRREPIAEAIDRIAAEGKGSVTARRRLLL